MTDRITKTIAAGALAAAMAMGSMPANAGALDVAANTLDRARIIIIDTKNAGGNVGYGAGVGAGAALGGAVGLTGGATVVTLGAAVSVPASVIGEGGNTFKQAGDASAKFAISASKTGAHAGGEVGSLAGKAIAGVGATAVVGSVVITGLVVGGAVYAVYRTALFTAGTAWNGAKFTGKVARYKAKGAGRFAKKIATAGN